MRIKDKRLALLHYSCMIAIFLYVVCYTIIYNKAYYNVEAPVGTVRINPKAPKPWTETVNLPYCKHPSHPSRYHLTNVSECKYFDEALNVFPQSIDESITITTRVNISTQTPNAPLNSSSVKWIDYDNEFAFMAEPENFTVCFFLCQVSLKIFSPFFVLQQLMIDHSFYAPTLNIQGNARDVCPQQIHVLILFLFMTFFLPSISFMDSSFQTMARTSPNRFTLPWRRLESRESLTSFPLAHFSVLLVLILTQ